MKTIVSVISMLALMICVCQATVIHVPGDQPTIQAGIDAARVYIVLFVYDQLFFWPTWSTAIDYSSWDLPVGLTAQEILNFQWPSTGTSGTGAFISLMTSEDGTAALGTWDIESFMWS